MGRRGKQPHYMSLDRPPEDILDEARCDPGTAWYFDHMAHDYEPASSRLTRYRVAQRICNGIIDAAGTVALPGCPVKEMCLLWALENEEQGVYGGTLVTTRLINRFKKTGALRWDERPLRVKEPA